MWIAFYSPRVREVLPTTTTMTQDKPLFDPTVYRSRSRGSAPGGDYGNLVGYFVDVCRAFSGQEPPKKVRDRIGVEAGKLVKEGVSPDALRKGIQILVDRGLDPSHLPECVFTAQQKPDTPVGPDRERGRQERELIQGLLALHDGRWPTGARLVRGTHSATAVWDPLGYDPRPSDFPYERPTRAQILKALAEEASGD